MVTVNRLAASWLAACVLGAAIMGMAGCESKPITLAPSPLADYTADLPSAVRLPQGFYPLAGQYEADNQDDYYDNGWPRHIVSERDDMIMVYVPAQTLTMGGGVGDDEVPARMVTVSHFYIDIHEVTNAQFNRFRKIAVKREDKAALPWHPAQPLTFADPDYDGAMGRPWAVSRAYAEYWTPNRTNSHPARNVSWWEAMSYCKWAGKTLPTEAQWETAARGNDRRLYPWGNEEQSDQTRYLCNARTGREDFDGYEYTAPVLSYGPGISPYGVYQLAGNVWEWCLDWYDPGRYAYPSSEDPPTGLDRGAKPFGDRNYPNPRDKIIRETRVGPLRGDQRVMRGGSFADPVERCRVDARASALPDAHEHNVGFRCVLPLPPERMVVAGR